MTRLTQSALRAVVHYDPETGVFTRLIGWGRARAGKPSGSVDKVTGYLRVAIHGRQKLAHRLAWFYMTGEWPKEQIDHRDMNKLNNAWSNLREATHLQNNLSHGLRKDNKTGLKGVKRHSQVKTPTWVARIRLNHIERHLGSFNCPAAAHFAYVIAAAKLHGAFARFA